MLRFPRKPMMQWEEWCLETVTAFHDEAGMVTLGRLQRKYYSTLRRSQEYQEDVNMGASAVIFANECRLLHAN